MSKAMRQKRAKEKLPNLLLCPRFAHHRCVVERVIGRLKTMSNFVTGPVYASQSRRLRETVLVVCAISNVLLNANPNLYVSE